VVAWHPGLERYRQVGLGTDASSGRCEGRFINHAKNQKPTTMRSRLLSLRLLDCRQGQEASPRQRPAADSDVNPGTLPQIFSG
jgi:hypothetical protein